MTESELRNYSRFLFEQLQSKDKQMQSILDSLDEIKEELKRSRFESAAEQKRLLNKLAEQADMLNMSYSENQILQKKNEDLVSYLGVFNRYQMSTPAYLSRKQEPFG